MYAFLCVIKIKKSQVKTVSGLSKTYYCHSIPQLSRKSSVSVKENERPKQILISLTQHKIIQKSHIEFLA